MASIIKRKKNYSVVYNYVDENGETKQKWETWHTHKEALKRKAEIENQVENETTEWKEKYEEGESEREELKAKLEAAERRITDLESRNRRGKR